MARRVTENVAALPDGGWNVEGDNWHFWGPLDCEVLFWLFENSADENRGVPTILQDDVIGHVTQCSACQDCDVRVSVYVDGTAVLEYSAEHFDELIG